MISLENKLYMIKVAIIGCRSNTKFFIEFLLNQKINIQQIISIDKKTAELNNVPDYIEFKKIKL